MTDRLEENACDYSPITSADDPWHELRVGEYALAIGALRSVYDPRQSTGEARNYTPSITVGFSDWTELLVAMPDGVPVEVAQLREGFRMLNFKLRRTEDGFEGVAVWETGCAPIPLVDPQLTTVS